MSKSYPLSSQSFDIRSGVDAFLTDPDRVRYMVASKKEKECMDDSRMYKARISRLEDELKTMKSIYIKLKEDEKKFDRRLLIITLSDDAGNLQKFVSIPKDPSRELVERVVSEYIRENRGRLRGESREIFNEFFLNLDEPTQYYRLAGTELQISLNSVILEDIEKQN